MERKWYYAVDGVRHGPVTEDELWAQIEAGAVRPADLVWQPDFGPEWRTVELARASFERPAPQIPAPEASLPKEPLLGVAGQCPSCLEAAAQAYSRVASILFKPFDVRRWFSIGFCAWLAYIGTQSGNFTSVDESVRQATLKQQVDGFLEKLAGLPSHPGMLVFVVSFLALSLLLGLWLCSLRSRGDFMFLHRWYHPDVPILQCWNTSRSAGHALFVWRVQFFFVCVLLYAADFAFAWSHIARPYMEAGNAWSAELVRPAVICVTAAVLFAMAMQIVAHFAKAFVVPVMYWRDVAVAKAWRVVFELCNRYPLAVLGYFSLTVFFWLGAALAIALLVLCTCCVGAIPLLLPYFNAVMLLPVYLFFRGFPVCFLSQWRAGLIPPAA